LAVNAGVSVGSGWRDFHASHYWLPLKKLDKSFKFDIFVKNPALFMGLASEVVRLGDQASTPAEKSVQA